MTALAGTIVKWILHHFLNLLLIFAVLLAGRAVWTEWTEWNALQSVRVESAQLTEFDRGLTAKIDRLVKASTVRAAGLRSASMQALDSRGTTLDQEIATKRLSKQQSSTLGKVLSGTSIVQAQVDAMLVAAEIDLLEQERSYLLELKLRLLHTRSEKINRAELERLQGIHQSFYFEWQKVGGEIDALKKSNPLKCRFGYGTYEFNKCRQLQTRRAQLLTENRLADADYQRQMKMMQDRTTMAPLGVFNLRLNEVDAIVQPIRDRIKELNHRFANNWFEKLLRPVQEVAPAALLILLGIILTPVTVKAFFYFVLAPMAARRAPLHFLPESTGELALETGHSALSRQVVVEADHELLLHAEFLQNSSVRGDKDTLWLLNHKFPLTSLASGMVALTRIRTAAPETFVISATQDPLSEIGIISLPKGAAFVMQPHNLVGVVQLRASPVRITSHWRLNSLHAWLTLQLRYLAFHGPARLIVQGCRGVRIERPDAGRSINQASTIGFSANLAYSTRRSETFSAYWLGKQELLNDSFSGEDGFYVYEEVSHFNKKTGLAGRGLEGLTDSLLKVLGI